jgi:hypothetical protein
MKILAMLPSSVALPPLTVYCSPPACFFHNAAVVVTEGESFRMREAKTRGGLPHVARPMRGRERREEAPAED